MKKLLNIWMMAILVLSSCQKQLDVKPKGVLDETQVLSPEGVEGLVIAAYSQLGNDHYDVPFSLWPYGNVRADDAYKGGRDAADMQDVHFLETFTGVRPDFGEFDGIWYNCYVGVRRSNSAISAINQLSDEQYPNKALRLAEARFLRGHYYFLLKILFKYIPYIDENVPVDEYPNINNRTLSNDELWEKIVADFQFAAETLPTTQNEIGRTTSIAANAYLAKARLYQAYEQNEQHQVTNINQQRLQQVVEAVDKVLTSGKHLENDFANNFLSGAYENGSESLFAVQFSQNDQTLKGRLNYGDVLSVPQGLGCCDFQKPSQNLVNAFKTDQNGLPLFESFNEDNIGNSTLDPRLHHTVAMPGNPWKYEISRVFTEGWSRNPNDYGVYASLKENVSPDCDCFINIDPFYGNTKNRIILRLADVMLFKAEALIELGRQEEALPIINELRNRAKNSTSLLIKPDGTAQGNYHIAAYIPGINISDWTQETARKALRFERRLEMALEGSRFFDLVRWGIAGPTLNTYFSKEKQRRPILSEGNFKVGKDEYLPIPQNQLFFSKGVYIQNNGY